jgi:hypothetical protein
MKSLGVTTAAIGTLAVIYQIYGNGISFSPLAIMAGSVCLLFLLGWLFWITPKWVKTTGDAYAERLLEASEELIEKGNPSKARM